ncbi:MAG: bifunctional phosphoribosylaminoimidazolecarboxamide formyltransferase/IMP cyclohydrolase [Luteitalea sp.]|nr:bifunctional phosphoribosylaminoimidazolecarboxamide formyltransferase/IMP cyclohydrolase [Luteitalea sp.]
MPRALLSVSDKRGLVEFASGLVGRGWEIVSTGGTARALGDAGVPVTQVADVTRFPEMMDGRVKTLHPRIHGGILARRHRPDDLAAARRERIDLIDLVAVNLYPFARAAADPATTFDALVEEIDIGGPSLARAAAKNFRDVLVVIDPSDYASVLERVADLPGFPLPLRLALARKAFAHTAEYDRAIARELERVRVNGERVARVAPASSTDEARAEDGQAADGLASQGGELPDRLAVQCRRIRTLRYGENPHQRAAWYAQPDARALGAATVHQGKELSYTNLLDLDAAARIVLELEEPASAVIKHTNPCGVAVGVSAAEAYVRARDADRLSAFGGVVALNRTLDEAAASVLVSTFIEAVIAPAVEPGALEILARKPNLRVVSANLARSEGVAPAALEARSILGALLIQEHDRVTEAEGAWPPAAGVRVVTARAPTEDEWRGLRFAWRVCAHVKSNAVVFAGPDRTFAIGAGQMSRVDAVKVAAMKATAPLTGSVVASDAFFPFRDGVDAIAQAGATAIVQPGGSVRDAESIAAADEHGLAMIFTGVRHFRH